MRTRLMLLTPHKQRESNNQTLSHKNTESVDLLFFCRDDLLPPPMSVCGVQPCQVFLLLNWENWTRWSSPERKMWDKYGWEPIKFLIANDVQIKMTFTKRWWVSYWWGRDVIQSCVWNKGCEKHPSLILCVIIYLIANHSLVCLEWLTRFHSLMSWDLSELKWMKIIQ